jgi:hypothetical protein
MSLVTLTEIEQMWKKLHSRPTKEELIKMMKKLQRGNTDVQRKWEAEHPTDPWPRPGNHPHLQAPEECDNEGGDWKDIDIHLLLHWDCFHLVLSGWSGIVPE